MEDEGGKDVVFCEFRRAGFGLILVKKGNSNWEYEIVTKQGKLRQRTGLPLEPTIQNTASGNDNLWHRIRTSINTFLLSLDKRVRLRVAIGICVILFMANLDALTDAMIHPGVLYFDQEHLIVGGATAIVTVILFGLLSIYVAILKRAFREIKRLEGLLPICSSCHKIRSDDNNWHVLEKYISERTQAVFTHSLCPECARRLYPQMYEEHSSNHAVDKGS